MNAQKSQRKTNQRLPISTTLLFLMLFCGCASPKAQFQTQKLPAYSGKLEKVMIVFMEQDTSQFVEKNFLDQLAQALAYSLAQREIPSATVRIPKTTLDREESIIVASKHFYPKHLIFLGFTNLDRHWFGSPVHGHYETSVTLEFEIKETTSKTTAWPSVWRADASFPSPPTPKDAAQQLIHQLVAEGLL